MSEKLHEEIFPGTTLSSLIKDIYDNSTKKRKQVESLINELRPLVTDSAQAIMVVPLIQDYIDVGIKNDEILVKAASVYQKYLSSDSRDDSQKDGGMILTDEEKRQLVGDIGKKIIEAKDAQTKVDEDYDKLNKKLTQKLPETILESK